MLNPITYTERVVGDFLCYQLTAYPPSRQRRSNSGRSSRPLAPLMPWSR
jgi:hypothetical protein